MTSFLLSASKFQQNDPKIQQNKNNSSPSARVRMCVCVFVCVCAWVRACVRACVGGCVGGWVGGWVRGCVGAWVCVCVFFFPTLLFMSAKGSCQPAWHSGYGSISESFGFCFHGILWRNKLKRLVFMASLEKRQKAGLHCLLLVRPSGLHVQCMG